MIDEVRIAVDRLRQSWGWLLELAEPGRETRAGRVLSDVERRRLDELAADEREDRFPQPRWDADRGLWRWPAEDPAARAPAAARALVGAPTPVRLAVLDAQAQVHGLVLDAVRHVAAGLQASFVGRGGADAVAAALDWLDGGPRRWVGSPVVDVWVSSPAGVVERVRLGVVEVPSRLGVLDALPAGVGVMPVLARLLRADRVAREAAGVLQDLTAPLPDDCPACHQRSLQLHHDGDPRHQRLWYVKCASTGCTCRGAGCGCRRAVQWRGRPHVWTHQQLTGAWGLWAAIARSRREPVPIRSTRVGHGGWAERSSKGAA